MRAGNAASIGCLMMVLMLAGARRAEATTIYAFEYKNGGFVSPTVTTPNTTASDYTTTGAPSAFCGYSGGAPPPACGPYGNATVLLTINPASGFGLDVTGFSFDVRSWNAVSATHVDVFTSVDGFTSPILSSALVPESTSFTNHSTPLAFQGLTDPFTVHIVFSGGSDGPTFGLNAVDNITILATAVPLQVPEPATGALLAAGLAALAGRRLRGRTGRP